MKPYFVTKRRKHAVIAITDTYRMTIKITEDRHGKTASFSVPEMALSRNEARSFITACKMALNFTQKAGIRSKGGGGGRVSHEFNDGKDWWWSDKFGTHKVSWDGSYISVPFITADPPMLRRVRKLVILALKKFMSRMTRLLLWKYLRFRW